MSHLVPVAHPSHLDNPSCVRLIVVIIGCLLHRMMILGACWPWLKATLRIEISLLLLLGLIADLNICEVVLIISVDCAGHTV